MIDLLSKNDLFFLKQVKEQILVKHQLPFDCLSVEYKDEIYFKIHFIMKKVPFEVFFHRYEILEEVAILFYFSDGRTANIYGLYQHQF